MRSIIFDVKFRAMAEKCPEGHCFKIPKQVVQALGLEADVHNLYLDIQENTRSVRDIFLLLKGNVIFLPEGVLSNHADKTFPVMVTLHRLIRREEDETNG